MSQQPLPSSTKPISSSSNTSQDVEDQHSTIPTSSRDSPARIPPRKPINTETSAKVRSYAIANVSNSDIPQTTAILPSNKFIDKEEDFPTGFPYHSTCGLFTFACEFLWGLQDVVMNSMEGWMRRVHELRVWCNACGDFESGGRHLRGRSW